MYAFSEIEEMKNKYNVKEKFVTMIISSLTYN